MLVTNAWAFLNICHPVCAWAAYRGVLVSAPKEIGFVSVWAASMMRANDHKRIERELALEHCRLLSFPHQVSRLTGMYCFTDITSAEKALSWNNKPDSHFRPEFLAELSLVEAESPLSRLDSNWITFGAPDGWDGEPLDWARKYWAGEAHPDHEPIWEVLLHGRLIVLGTELREKAYILLKKHFPQSLVLLETARLAAWTGSDLGNVCGHLLADGDDVLLEYLIDLRQANDPDFIQQLVSLRSSGHPINWSDLAPLIQIGSFVAPDFTSLGFRRPKSKMPYLTPKPA